jgi:hypothetical protein
MIKHIPKIPPPIIRLPSSIKGITPNPHPYIIKKDKQKYK